MGLAVLCLLCGCRTNQKSALTEAELRTREREIRELQTDLRRAETLNQAMTRELTDRRTCTAAPYPPSSAVVDGPAAMMSGMVKEVVLGRGTGGVDDDGWPGDEALAVVLVPQDVDGQAIKVPGSLVVIVFEITSDGLKVPLDRWDVAPLTLQKNWRSGLFSTGYFVTLPWKRWPASEKLRVVAQFTALAGGRVLEADRDVKIKLMPGGPRGVPVQGPPGTTVLPPPPKVVPPISEPDCLPGSDGPILPPGAWLRESRPSDLRLEAAKPAPSGQPARLLSPQLKPDLFPPEGS
jgi:hypothetical protein